MCKILEKFLENFELVKGIIYFDCDPTNAYEQPFHLYIVPFP